MDEIDDFLDFSKNKTFQKRFITGGTVAGRIIADERETHVESRRDIPETTNYANRYERELENDLRVRFNTRHRDTGENENPDGSVYSRYNFDYRGPKRELPIAACRENIIDKIYMNTVVVLQGSTGCGKTTQVPQYILDDARARGKYCNIVVAQPRRIAAQTNAQRVCNERGWQMGTVVGYQVGSDQQAHCGDDTRILFCTTGVLLEKLIHVKSIHPYTHIILDEVHERTKEMDFLMVIIYKFLNPTKRVVLMSATIDSEKFAAYFKLPSRSDDRIFERAPIVNIDGRRNFDVKKYYLDDLEAPYKENDPDYCSNISQQLSVAKPKVFDEQYTWALKLICLFERLDRIEWSETGQSIEKYDNSPKPTILVFLPGIHEIMVMYRLLEEWKYLNQETQVLRIVLHSTAAPIQAHAAMQKTDRNVRKIILATNIAESSITVPDVKYVIDFCLTRTLVTDKNTNFSSLRLAWASRNNAEQRAGRTGRVRAGKCFRLVTKEFFNKHMRSSACPELLNCPLEDIILKIKVLNMGSPESILGLAMDKPNLSEIGSTILRLKEMGALLRTTNGLITEMDGDITFIGRVMASLPIDAKLSKLIIYGYCFSVLNECIVIAAALNCTKSIFKTVNSDGVRSYTLMLEWANGSGSDLFAMLNAYNKWSQMHQNKRFGTNSTKAERELMNDREKQWADRYNLQVPALRECETYVKDLHLRLKRLQLKALSYQKFKWSDTEKNIILKVVISGAFYPNYFLRSSPNRTQNEREMYNMLDGRDPTKTIYLKGFDNKYLRNIYALTIKQEIVKHGVIDNINKLKVTFDSGAQKVYVTFKTDGKKDDVREYGVACQPGFVLTEVYKAIRMRQLMRNSMKIPVLDDFSRECKYARRNNLFVDEATHLVRVENESEYRNICFPRVLEKMVKGSITHIENCDEFYLQPESEFEQVEQFSSEINRENNDMEPFEIPNEIHIGAILAAPYYDTDPRQTEYYRAKVLFSSDDDIQDPKFMVQFIDFGNSSICKFRDLRRLSGVSAQYIRIPARCFRCALAEIQPSILKAPNGIWPKEATEMFRKLTADKVVAEVYSTFDGIARVIIRTRDDKNINDLLVENGYAERCEENYMSKQSNLIRKKKQSSSDAMQPYNKANYLDDGTLRYLREEDIPDIRPPPHAGQSEVTLNGPHSPLETKIYPLTKGGQSQTVEVDPHSVNIVMLENEPNDISYKYLVAVSVCQKIESTTEKIVARQTTMMPHIRGFGPLMAAIFCPQMELARDKSNSHYVSMITGLGYDKNAGRPMFAENDMTFELDTEITVKDLEKVNRIRHSMNSLLYTEPKQLQAINFDDVTKSKLMAIIRDLTIGLLTEPRHAIAYEGGNIAWNQYLPEEINHPRIDDDQYHVRAIFPLHKILKLERENGMKLMDLQNHNEELCNLARSERSVERNIICRLCNDPMIETTVELQHHLLSRVHVDRLNAIESTLIAIYGGKAQNK